jgi:hypothetical protein
LNALETWRASLPDTPEERLPKALKLVVPGAPRTKKNSPVLITGMTDAWLRDLIIQWTLDRPDGHLSENDIMRWVADRDVAMPHPRLLPSQAYRDWEAGAVKAVLPVLEPLRRFFPINYSCHLLAKVYRDADRGDWCGYMQGIGDFLEDVGIVEDDVLLRSIDGSRLCKDAENPRIELWLTPWTQEGDTGLFERPARDWAEHEEPEPDPVDCIAATDTEEMISADEEQRGGYRPLVSRYAGRR